jgi:uncharacterized protein DUF6457
VNEWLEQAMAAIGSDEQLSDEDADTLLKIARYAAHEGGDRTNAPLLTYLLGRARGDRSLSELFEAIRSS